MEIEQLKLIIDLARDAGEGVFWIAILWLGQGYFSILLNSITIGLLVICIYKIANAIRRSMSFTSKVKNVIGYFEPEDLSQTKNILSWISKHHETDPVDIHRR